MSQLPSTFVKGFHDEEAVRKMEYIPLGKTGISISKISMGGGTLAPFYGELDVTDALQTIRKAIRCGINYIDTAPYYGQGRSEEIIGQALKGIPREAYYIATKIGRYGINEMDFSAKRTKESVHKSLELLGLDYIDVIQMHDVEFVENLDTVIDEALPALEELRAEGKIRFIGVNGYPLNILLEAIKRAPGRFDTVLAYSRYTLIDHSLVDYLPEFLNNNVGVICAAGFAMGLLTNGGPQKWHPCDQETKDRCEQAAGICRQNGIELGKLAAHYFMQLKGPSTFLMGMQTERLLDINLEAYYNGLTDKEQKILDQLTKTILLKKVHWEGAELRSIFGR